MAKWMKLLTILLVVLVITGFGLKLLIQKSFQIWYERADRGVEVVTQKLEALREAGLPVDNASMDTWYRQRTDPSDAAAWQAIFDQLNSPEFKSLTTGIETFDSRARDTGRKDGQWPAEEACRNLLAETTDLRSEIHRLAARRVRVQFPMVFDSINTQMASKNSVVRASRLISVESEVAIHDKKSSEIVASILTQVDLGIAASSDGSITGNLFASAMRSSGFRTLKEALEADLIDANDLSNLESQLSPLAITQSWFREAIQIERATMLPVFHEPSKYLGNRSNQIPKNYQASAQDKLHYLEMMEQLEELDDLPMANAIQKAKQLEADLKKQREAAGILGTREWMLTSLLLPATITTFTTCCRDHQELNMVLHGIAIRRYQDQFGEFPRDLFALKDVGFDTLAHMPVGDKPMGYRLEGDEAVLWSTPPALGLETTPEPPTISPSTPKYELLQIMLWRFKP